MEKIKNLINRKLNLSIKISSDVFECYQINDRCHLIYLNESISHDDIKNLLNKIDKFCKETNLDDWKSFMVLAETDEEFSKKELFYFDNVNTFVSLFLINQNKNKIFSNPQWVFVRGVGFRKYVKQIESILRISFDCFSIN